MLRSVVRGRSNTRLPAGACIGAEPVIGTERRADPMAGDDSPEVAQCDEASGIFLVALQQLDRNALWAANEADAHAGPDGGRRLGEFDALGLDLGSNRVDVLYSQSEVVEPLIGRQKQLWIFHITL